MLLLIQSINHVVTHFSLCFERQFVATRCPPVRICGAGVSAGTSGFAGAMSKEVMYPHRGIPASCGFSSTEKTLGYNRIQQEPSLLASPPDSGIFGKFQIVLREQRLKHNSQKFELREFCVENTSNMHTC